MSTNFKLHAPYLGNGSLEGDIIHLETNAENVIMDDSTNPPLLLKDYISDTMVSIGNIDDLPSNIEHLWIKTVETESDVEVLKKIRNSNGFVYRDTSKKYFASEKFFNVSRINSPNLHIDFIPGLRNWIGNDPTAIYFDNGVLNIPFALDFYDGVSDMLIYDENEQVLSSYFIFDNLNGTVNNRLLYIFANHNMTSLYSNIVEYYQGKPEIILSIDTMVVNGKHYHISEIMTQAPNTESNRYKSDTRIRKFGRDCDGGSYLRINIPNINVAGETSDGVNIVSFMGYNNWTGKRFMIASVFRLYYNISNVLTIDKFPQDSSPVVITI